VAPSQLTFGSDLSCDRRIVSQAVMPWGNLAVGVRPSRSNGRYRRFRNLLDGRWSRLVAESGRDHQRLIRIVARFKLRMPCATSSKACQSRTLYCPSPVDQANWLRPFATSGAVINPRVWRERASPRCRRWWESSSSGRGWRPRSYYRRPRIGECRPPPPGCRLDGCRHPLGH